MNNRLQGEPLDVEGSGERKYRMATLVLPVPALKIDFETAELNAEWMNWTAKLANRARYAKVFWVVSVAIYGFARMVGKQERLIICLNEDSIQNLPTELMDTLAQKIEHLVLLNDQLLDSLESPSTFAVWSKVAIAVRSQRDKLDSLAESFRMACDEESLELLADFARIAESENSSGSGMLVGTMHT